MQRDCFRVAVGVLMMTVVAAKGEASGKLSDILFRVKEATDIRARRPLTQEDIQRAKKSEAPEQTESKCFRALGWSTYGAAAADLYSTERGLARGAQEGNPFMCSRTTRVLFTVATPALVNWGSAELYKRGSKKWATAMRVALVVGYGYVTAHNLRKGG